MTPLLTALVALFVIAIAGRYLVRVVKTALMLAIILGGLVLGLVFSLFMVPF